MRYSVIFSRKSIRFDKILYDSTCKDSNEKDYVYVTKWNNFPPL